ncbi:ADP/ATP carrier protein [Coemansia sp. RSA 2706]|nr:ADP/ATP carrier protein [Coemansia sp. RSA 2706]KAJ2310562.1 ADP/ATP carrier protein [Coemansia sp. RSA 2705]KAJ2317973.1 ADP/ATP carrier protein [Coemansia sp. RSA 2704]KAJ2327623.1 ADP/ATP carrier protein [Coemansia sp. RSA 2702]KAJ2733118.1 ADP/ATP carrier protein [Coemansia sp. Cherry 401B]
MSESTWNRERLQRVSVALATGGISAHLGTLYGAPIERVKLILQAQQSSSQITAANQYKGIIDVLKRIPREQGIMSFWRGNMANIVRYYPTQLLNFALKDTYKNILPKYNPQTEFGKFFGMSILSGGLTGMTALLFVYPLDLARTRMALDFGTTSDTRQFTGLWNCLTTVYKSGGIGSLYYGYAAAAVGVIAYRALFFGLYDAAKQRLFSGPEKPNYFKSWLVYQTVATLATLLTYPLHTISRNLAMQAGRSDVLYTGTLDCVRKLYANGGIRSFYGGAMFSIITSVGGALMLVAYDAFKSHNKSGSKDSADKE